MKKLLLIGIPVLALLIALGISCRFVFDTDTAAYRYVQVDNSRVASDDADDEYEYALDAYDEAGASHEVTFKTERILRDDAYLEVRTMPLRGVISWAEVQPEDIPAPARSALGA